MNFSALISTLVFQPAQTPGVALWQSSLLGGVLLVLADYIASHTLSPFQIPVGLVMGAVGGLYLLLILVRSR